MNKYVGLLAGLVFLLVAIYVWIVDWAGFGVAAMSLLKGSLVWIFLIVGVMFVVIGLNDLKN